MRNVEALAILASLLLGASACRQHNPADDVDGAGISVKGGYENPRPEGVSSPNDPVTTTLYVDQAAIGDLYEIEAAKVALRRSKNPQVREFAQLMLTHHQLTLDNLKKFVAENPINRAPSQNLDSRRRAMITNLEEASDAEFDDQYLGQQAAAHDEAYNLQRSFANGGDYPLLGRTAAKAAELVQQHRQKLASLREEID